MSALVTMGHFAKTMTSWGRYILGLQHRPSTELELEICLLVVTWRCGAHVHQPCWRQYCNSHCKNKIRSNSGAPTLTKKIRGRLPGMRNNLLLKFIQVEISQKGMQNGNSVKMETRGTSSSNSKDCILLVGEEMSPSIAAAKF